MSGQSARGPTEIPKIRFNSVFFPLYGWPARLIAASLVVLRLWGPSPCEAETSLADAPTAAVARVVDGDSLRLADGREVRLIGIDTPEFKDQKRNRSTARRLRVEAAAYSAQAAGARAAALRFLKGPAGPRAVRLETDPANAASGHKDKYGRLLAYVWVSGEEGEFLLNEELLKGGHAAVFRAFPFGKRERFLAAESEAREARRGFWAGSR